MKTVCFYTLLTLLIFNCKSTLDVEYELLNDIIEEQKASNKTYLVRYCGESTAYDQVISTFYNSDRKVLEENYRGDSLLVANEALNWIFTQDDVDYMNQTYQGKTFDVCWDRNEIKHELYYINSTEWNSIVSDEMALKYYKKEVEYPFSETDQTLQVLKPFLNKDRTKAIFVFHNSKTANGIATPKIAIARKTQGKWIIIGYVYDGWD